MRLVWSFVACTTIFVSGCSIAPVPSQSSTATPVTPVTPTPATTKSISGRVHGGQQGLVGAHVYLFAIPTNTTVGQPSISRLIAGPDTTNDGSGNYYVTTVAGGQFTVGAGDYNCGPSGPEQVYLYSTGGDPGTGQSNPAAGLLAVLGSCTTKVITPVPTFVTMNEVTTVAAAYALAGFASGPTAISGVKNGTTQGLTGLANAVALAGLLADIGQGTASAPPGAVNGTTVQQTINTLGNILAACINAVGPSASGCTQILPYAGNASDTAQAAINIAQTGGGSQSNIDSIWGAASAYQQFSNALNAEPTDWTLPIIWSDTLHGPLSVAIDSGGNAFVVEAGDGDSQVSIFTPSGTTAAHSPFTGNGLADPQGIAIDTSGNVWVTNFQCPDPVNCVYQLSEFASNGNSAPDSPFTAAGPSYNVAIDASGNAWMTNNADNSISEYGFSSTDNQTEQLLNTGSISADSGTLNFPAGICLQGTTGSNSIWIANSGPDGTNGTTLAQYSSSGVNVTGPPASPYTLPGTSNGPINCAIDAAGKVWTANYGDSSSTDFSNSNITVFNSDGTLPTNNTFNGGGVSGAYGGAFNIAVDGGDNIWTVNNGPFSASGTGGSISEFANDGTAISPANGFLNGSPQPQIQEPEGLAIDGSGNVWVVDAGDNKLIELVGAARPVVTPLAAAVANNQLGTTP